MLLYTRRKNSSDSQSAFCTHSAVCSLHFVPSLHFVSGLQSAFCTDRYPWHQHSLFLVIVIRTTHTIYHKIPVCELNRHFRYFRVNTLSFCKNIDVTYNVSSNPPTSEKKNKFLHAYHAYLLKYVDVTCSIQVVHRIQGWMEEKLQNYFKRDTECLNHNMWMLSCMIMSSYCFLMAFIEH